MPEPTGGYYLDQEDYFGLATTWLPGDTSDPNRVADPSQMVRLDSVAGLSETFNRDDHETMVNSIDTGNYMNTGIAREGGGLALRFYPNNGAEILIGGVGNEAYQAALSADVTTAISTANGLTLATATNAAAYRKGGLLEIGTGSTKELVPIISYNSGTKVLTLPETYNTHTGVGSDIVGDAYHLISPYTRSSGYHRLLRRFCLLNVPGGQYGEIFPGQCVDSWTLTAGDPAISLAAEFRGNAPRQDIDSTPFAFDPTDTSLGDLAFLLQRSYLVLPADPASSGTPTQQIVEESVGWSVSVNNNLIERARGTRRGVYQYTRGPRTVTVAFTLDQASSYPLFHEKYVKTNTSMEFFAFGYQNIGTAAAPVFVGFCIYCPSLRLQTSPRVSNSGVVGEQVTGIAQRTGTGTYPESIYISLKNSKTTTYAAVA